MKDFPPGPKVWIYQADRVLTETELILLATKAKTFIADWTAHGKLLKAHLEILHKRFLVLLVDETQAGASGCGIDKSVHFFQEMERELNINLMNRLLVAYKENSEVKTCSLAAFEKKIESGEVTAETLVFNNLVTTKSEFDTHWEIPLRNSWHSKLLA